MTKDINKTYQEQLNKLKETVLGTGINTELELRKMGQAKLDELCEEVERITKKKVINNFYFITGKIMGLMNAITFNSRHWDELMEVTGLTKDYIDVYKSICGQLPYFKADTNTLNMGQMMDARKMKELIPAIGAQIGVVVYENDTRDITEEYYTKIFNDQLMKAMESAGFAEYAQNLNTEYEKED